MHHQGNLMKLTDEDVSLYVNMIQTCGFHEIHIKKLNKSIMNASMDGLITREQFNTVLKEIFKEKEIRVEDRKSVFEYLNRIFSMLDHQHSNTVSSRELAGGFSIVGYGSKSAKLQHAFS